MDVSADSSNANLHDAVLLLAASTPVTSGSDTETSTDASTNVTPVGSGTPTGSVVVLSRDRSGTIIARPVWDPTHTRSRYGRDSVPPSPSDSSRPEMETKDEVDGDGDVDVDRSIMGPRSRRHSTALAFSSQRFRSQGTSGCALNL